MATRQTALIITNYPILIATAHRVFSDRYEIEARSWANLYDGVPLEPDLVIVDVTTVPAADAFSRLGPRSRARVVVFSLHHNEVKVGTLDHHGLKVELALPSLLALAA